MPTSLSVDDSGSRPGTENAERGTGPTRIAHLSDIHFGKIAHPEIVDAAVADVNASGAALVVVSGDLTQRARTGEYEAARAMLDAFDAPTLVVPGNHDVAAWWHDPFQRVFDSDQRFRRFIDADRTPTAELPGVVVFGLDSAHGLTIKGGKIRPRHLAEAEVYFARQPPEAFRIVTLHHHLLRLQSIGSHDVARGARRALDTFRRVGVDLVLCGHLHRSRVESVETALGRGGRLVVASAGTATSSRGRGSDADTNLYNWVDVWPDRFEVEERQYRAGAFATERRTAFDRSRRISAGGVA